ncbi:uncharacterized protein EDB91DRAFT_1251091 [Suillus paluster]|uniref:uncharacterized protein n=1 Tax=Suillus paluster TaxID=48578 RepID=UPI001B868942|nr:uncharacterized protein EDB91DRAFT_1251091 [Suillus paluster]KAG1734049.1 hypothetical protein EDB91DRAFT_1251091 [Suillus paluster]
MQKGQGFMHTVGEFPTTRPPKWLHNGIQNITYQDILTDRLTLLGNWRFYQCLIHPFWHDPAILHGLEEMFRIFMPANLICKSYETLDTEHDFVPYVPLDDSAVGATHEMMIEIIKRMLNDMKDEAPPSPKVIEDACECYQARLCHDFTSDDVEDIHICQEHSASHESRQSQHNRHPGLRDLMIPTGVQGTQPSPPPTFSIFHLSGSPDSPQFLVEDLASLPHAFAASQATKSFNMSSTPLAQVTGKRPYIGTYTPKPGRSSAVSVPSLASTAVDPVDRARLRTDTTTSLMSSSTSTSSSKATQPSDTQCLQYPISQTILEPEFFHGLPTFNLHGSASTGLVHTTLPAIHKDEDGDEDNQSRKKPCWQGL